MPRSEYFSMTLTNDREMRWTESILSIFTTTESGCDDATCPLYVAFFQSASASSPTFTLKVTMSPRLGNCLLCGSIAK